MLCGVASKLGLGLGVGPSVLGAAHEVGAAHRPAGSNLCGPHHGLAPSYNSPPTPKPCCVSVFGVANKLGTGLSLGLLALEATYGLCTPHRPAWSAFTRPHCDLAPSHSVPHHCGHLASSDWCRVATKLGVGLSLHLLHLGVVYGLHTLHRPNRSNLLGR